MSRARLLLFLLVHTPLISLGLILLHTDNFWPGFLLLLPYVVRFLDMLCFILIGYEPLSDTYAADFEPLAEKLGGRVLYYPIGLYNPISRIMR